MTTGPWSSVQDVAKHLGGGEERPKKLVAPAGGLLSTDMSVTHAKHAASEVA